MANVTITLLSAQAVTTRSNANGAFGFDNLEPGSYFLRADKVGYGSVQQIADVVAGVADPPIVKILLNADLATTPFVDAYVFDGFTQGSFTLVAVRTSTRISSTATSRPRIGAARWTAKPPGRPPSRTPDRPSRGPAS